MNTNNTIPCKQWINNQANKNLVSTLEQYASVMSDPNKVRIMLLLDQYNKHENKNENKLYVSDLAEHLSMSVSAVSHSLRHLQNQKFVSKEKEGRSVRYSLTSHGDKLITLANKLTA